MHSIEALLKSITNGDGQMDFLSLLYLKRQGQRLWMNYLHGENNILDTILAIYRQRLSIEAPYFKDVEAIDLLTKRPFIEEAKGTRKEDVPAQMLSTAQELRERWNHFFHPWHRPNIHFTLDSFHHQFGDDQVELSLDREKFTVVFMTYKRRSAIKGLLETLHSNPLIDKIIMNWNDINSTANISSLNIPDSWMKKLHIVLPVKNSLNNRFLPYDIIATDAVLCIDDDTRVHNSALFTTAFRTWQENRNHIVGISARDFATNEASKFIYTLACPYSMILTGFLFVHKVYLYHYTYNLPQKLLSAIDAHMNCEDIFMNAMVSDLTGQSPVKATRSRDVACYSSECTGGRAISHGGGHHSQRNACVNELALYFGYQPLIKSVIFADSFPDLHNTKCVTFT